MLAMVIVGNLSDNLNLCCHNVFNYLGICGAWQLSGRMLDTQLRDPGFDYPFAEASKVGDFHSLHPSSLRSINDYPARHVCQGVKYTAL